MTPLKFFAVILTDYWDCSRWKSHQNIVSVAWSPPETILKFKCSDIITQTVICWEKRLKGLQIFPSALTSLTYEQKLWQSVFSCFKHLLKWQKASGGVKKVTLWSWNTSLKLYIVEAVVTCLKNILQLWGFSWLERSVEHFMVCDLFWKRW